MAYLILKNKVKFTKNPPKNLQTMWRTRHCKCIREVVAAKISLWLRLYKAVKITLLHGLIMKELRSNYTRRVVRGKKNASHFYHRLSSTTCKPGHVFMDVAAVVCRDRLEETMNMVKSILIFTNQQVRFHIVAERDLQHEVQRKFESFPGNVKQHFQFTIYNLSYPPGEDEVAWKKLFKTCASQRLFLLVILCLHIQLYQLANSRLSTLVQLLFSFDQDTRVDETLM